MTSMAMTNAEKQAAWRARRDAKLKEQAKEIAALKRKLSQLEAKLKERDD